MICELSFIGLKFVQTDRQMSLNGWLGISENTVTKWCLRVECFNFFFKVSVFWQFFRVIHSSMKSGVPYQKLYLLNCKIDLFVSVYAYNFFKLWNSKLLLLLYFTFFPNVKTDMIDLAFALLKSRSIAASFTWIYTNDTYEIRFCFKMYFVNKFCIVSFSLLLF